TWAEVTDRTRRIAAVLHEAGIGRHSFDALQPWESSNDHLGILLFNGPEYLETLLGAHKASVAPFNLNYRYTSDELAEIPADPAPLLPPPSPDDVHLLYTGGTTGRPKGVIWRVGDLVAGPLGVRDRRGRPLSLAEAVRRAAADTGPVLPAPPLMHGAGTWFA